MDIEDTRNMFLKGKERMIKKIGKDSKKRRWLCNENRKRYNEGSIS